MVKLIIAIFTALALSTITDAANTHLLEWRGGRWVEQGDPGVDQGSNCSALAAKIHLLQEELVAVKEDLEAEKRKTRVKTKTLEERVDLFKEIIAVVGAVCGGLFYIVSHLAYKYCRQPSPHGQPAPSSSAPPTPPLPPRPASLEMVELGVPPPLPPRRNGPPTH